MYVLENFSQSQDSWWILKKLILLLFKKLNRLSKEKKKLTDADNSMVITRGKEGKVGINGDGSTPDLGWTHNTICRWYITELYTLNLYNFIDQCYPNKFSKKLIK